MPADADRADPFQTGRGGVSHATRALVHMAPHLRACGLACQQREHRQFALPSRPT